MKSSLIINHHRTKSSLGAVRKGVYVFHNADLDSQDSSTMSVVLQQVLHTCDTLTVYRATLDGQDIVLKISWESDTLHHEATNYRTILRPLQGDVIPRYYGIFEGEMEFGGRSTCLVLEYCGEDLPEPFNEIPQSERLDILNKLARLHKLGYMPSDSQDARVVGHNGDYRHINFTKLDLHPECGWKGEWHQDVIRPEYDAECFGGDFGCRELWDMALYLDLWPWAHTHAPRVSIAGKLRFAAGLPPQDIIDQITPPDFVATSSNVHDLYKWISKIGQMDPQGQMSVADMIAIRPAFRKTVGWMD